MKFRVHVDENRRTVVVYEIEAATPEEAADMVGDGEGTEIDRSEEHDTDCDVRFVEDNQGKTVLEL